MACACSSMARHLVLFCLASFGHWAAVAQQQQGNEPPKFLSDEGKDLFSDLQADDHPFAEKACETREKLLKSMIGNGHQQASQLRAHTLLELGICDFNKGDYTKAKKRMDSTVGELNIGNEDMLLQNPDLAPIGLWRQATDFMKKYELTQAGTALRRAREVIDRNNKKIMKYVHKQMSQQGNAPPLENMIAELPGYGKTGQILPTLIKQVPILKRDLPMAEQVDMALETLDKQLAGMSPSLKAKRKTLDTSKGTKTGSLCYVRALATESTVSPERFAAATELVSGGTVKAFQEEAASLEKSVTLVKRSKDGPGCKEGKGMDKTCKAIAKVADIKSNGFGETRVIVVKAGKKQQLEMCSTNANLAVLVAAKDGVKLTVGSEEPKELAAGEPLVVDFCQESSLEADAQVPVLFAQAWHPEFAAIERTSELRDRAKVFGLSDDELKATTKIVNDNAKKSWEKTAKQWRSGSELLQGIKDSLTNAADEKKKAEEAAAEAKRKEEEDNDDERKKNLEKLEKKRAEKKAKEEEAERKRKERAKQLELERLNRDPWLNDPEVVAAKEKVDELKEARRDANAKLEFDLSTSLTKEISAAERKLNKLTKAAKKKHKKATAGDKKDEKEKSEASTEKTGGADDAEKLKKKLEEVKKKKAAAAEAEDFGEAKRLKSVQKDLEDKLKKLEL
mmetsp:Transcript_134435/g.244727  ORF Transcript_134435/g.244727 Transcript_134435/m.244727 type:complete len:679 (-) Transcript_134435:149-2185(-)